MTNRAAGDRESKGVAAGDRAAEFERNAAGSAVVTGRAAPKRERKGVAAGLRESRKTLCVACGVKLGAGSTSYPAPDFLPHHFRCVYPEKGGES